MSDSSNNSITSPKPSKKPVPWSKGVPQGVLSTTTIGLIGLGLFIGGFGYWSIKAPIAGAAIASGVVAANNENIRIQHLEGGIIKEVLVKEGETVAAGAALFRLDPTFAQATENRMTNELIALDARIARLKAESAGTDLEFKPEFEELAKSVGRQDDLNEQLNEFNKRRTRYETDKQIVEQQVAALNQQITGFTDQIAAIEKQLLTLVDELAMKKEMLDRQLSNRSDYLRLLRMQHELQGRKGALTSSIGETKTKILEAMQRRLRLSAERAETAATALNEVYRRRADISEQISQAKNVLSRVVIRAPATSVVVDLMKQTPGSVVRPGEDLAILLPKDEDLIIEARITPLDIDVVRVGQAATLRLSALNTRTTPEVPARVVYVSADSLTDAQTAESYYTARLELDSTLPEGLDRSEIYPGMPVETYISTGERTFLEYLVKPITDSFNRAFREE